MTKKLKLCSLQLKKQLQLVAALSRVSGIHLRGFAPRLKRKIHCPL